jgi:hypothetical protein
MLILNLQQDPDQEEEGHAPEAYCTSASLLAINADLFTSSRDLFESAYLARFAAISHTGLLTFVRAGARFSA